MKRIIKKVLKEQQNLQELKIYDFLKRKMDDSKKSWKSFVSIAKREGSETKEMIKVISKLLKGGEATPEEITFLKEQSKDIAKIVAVMSMGVVSMVIPIALEKILNKYGISIMPKDNTKKED
jgi:hypothetical protein